LPQRPAAGRPILTEAAAPDPFDVTTANREPREPELVLLLAAGRPPQVVCQEAKSRRQRSLMTWLVSAAALVAAYDLFLVLR
jgi:hypothetical protein